MNEIHTSLIFNNSQVSQTTQKNHWNDFRKKLSFEKISKVYCVNSIRVILIKINKSIIRLDPDYDDIIHDQVYDSPFHHYCKVYNTTPPKL